LVGSLAFWRIVHCSPAMVGGSMKVGDLVWSSYFETYGIIVKDYGVSNHHVDVLIDGEVVGTSKTKLEAVC